jgi:hypothetical protein
MNAQMHVGVRTDSFGAVEIHTVIQQSQVGITVHSDRDIARWFTSEVLGLESGLNKSHLNLTAVDFNSGRSGVQTSTGFQQGQQRQSFYQPPGSPSAGLAGVGSPEKDAAAEPATIDQPSSSAFSSDRLSSDGLSSNRTLGPARNHVSIHA